MIRRTLLLSFLLMGVMSFSQNFKEFRALMKTGESSETSAKLLIKRSAEELQAQKKPVYEAFLAVGNFFMAKHAINPLKKMSYFKQGKKMLEDAVRKDPKNLEIRLMRLISQEKTPKMLGYNQNITEDRNFLKKEYLNTNDEDLKIYIKKYLKL